MSSIEVKALDTLFFKDGKPFSMGEETWASGVFPPFPSVMYGTLRSIWFADHLPDLTFANSAKDESSKLAITGFLPALDISAAFPIPCDLFGLKNPEKQDAFMLQCIKKPAALLSEYLPDLLLQTNQIAKVEELSGKAFLPLAEFENYLNASAEEFKYELLSDYTTNEPKTGIGKDRVRRSSEHGLLYSVSMRRPEGRKGRFSFLIKYGGRYCAAPYGIHFIYPIIGITCIKEHDFISQFIFKNKLIHPVFLARKIKANQNYFHRFFIKF